MKKKITLSLFTLALVLIEITNAPAQTTIKVGVYQSWPSVFVDNRGQTRGIFIDILQHIAAREDWNLHFVPGSWAENLQRLREAEIDLLVGVAYSKEMARTYDFNYETVLTNWAQIYTPNGADIKTFLDLADKKIAVKKDDIHFQALRRLVKGFGISSRFIEAESYAMIFELLENHQVKAGLVSRLFGFQNRRKYSVEESPILFNPIEMRYAAPKNTHLRLLLSIDDHLRKIKTTENSVYHQTLSKWLMVDRQNVFPIWIGWTLAGTFGFALLLVASSIFFRFQVRARTADLIRTNRRLNAEIRERRQTEKALKASHQENEELFRQLQRTQKMEAVGALAGGIAHDFNNILFPIIGYVELAMEDLPEHPNVKANLRQVLKAANRARDLVQQILTYSRRSDQELKPSRIQVIIKEVLKLLRSSLPATVEIRQNIDIDCRPVMADPSQIHQIVMNLVTNAYHALENGQGILKVAVEEVDIEDQDVDYPYLTAGTYACLTVSDNGAGMPESLVDRIFDPYFTTKEKGKGTGLGLAVVHGIVKSYGGQIKVSSTPGQGSEFKIFLPCITSVVKEPVDLSPVQPHRSNKRILLVDDEEQIVIMLKEMLQRSGYQVTTQTNSSAALELFDNCPQAFDMIISDLTMPHMTGDKLATAVKTIRPDIPVMLCTGFSETFTETKARTIGIDAFIMKPVVRDQLIQSIEEILQEKRAA